MSSTSFLTSLLCVILVLYVQNAEGKPPSKIVAGQPTSIEKFPSAVSIRSHGRHRCGGSLITNRHVLTAAHCAVIQSRNSTVYERIRTPDSFRIIIGTSNSSDLRFEHAVKQVDVHEGYTGDVKTIWTSDIAILTLEEPVNSTKTCKPIALPSSNVNAGAVGDIVGWGFTWWNGSVEQILRQAEVTVYDNNVCRRDLGINIDDSQLCGIHPDAGFCTGDSGGPLIVNGEIVGVVSSSVFCGWEVPQIYTRVYSYVDWIRNIINLN